jgi:hypothetical protein
MVTVSSQWTCAEYALVCEQATARLMWVGKTRESIAMIGGGVRSWGKSCADRTRGGKKLWSGDAECDCVLSMDICSGLRAGNAEVGVDGRERCNRRECVRSGNAAVKALYQ